MIETDSYECLNFGGLIEVEKSIKMLMDANIDKSSFKSLVGHTIDMLDKEIVFKTNSPET